jgi:hypothetical protein
MIISAKYLQVTHQMFAQNLQQFNSTPVLSKSITYWITVFLPDLSLQIAMQDHRYVQPFVFIVLFTASYAHTCPTGMTKWGESESRSSVQWCLQNGTFASSNRK